MRNIKYRWNNKINFFFKNYKIDFWAYKLQKLNIYTKLNQNYFLRLESRWHGIKINRFIKQNFLFYNKKESFSLEKKKLDFFTSFINWKLKSKGLKNIIYNKMNQRRFLKEKFFLNLKSNRFRKSFFFKNKFNNKKILDWKKKKKNYFISSFFKEKNFCFNFFIKKIKIIKSSRLKRVFFKFKYCYLRRKLKTLFWNASDEIFFQNNKNEKKFKKKVFVKFGKKKNFKWQVWFINNILSCHYGFFSVKKLFLWKKLFFKKKKKNYSLHFFLENTLLILLARLNFFPSFRHIYLSIKYGLILVENLIITNPYFFVKKNKKITISSFIYKKKILSLIKDKIFRLDNNLKMFFTLPKFFEFYLPLMLLVKWREPKKYELKNQLSLGVPKYIFNWL